MYAIVHVALTTVLGYVCAFRLPPIIGIDSKWGVVGLTASASLAAWVEFVLLRRTLNKRIGRTGLPFSVMGKLLGAALAGAGVGWGLKLLLGPRHPLPVAVVVLGGFGVTYFAMTSLLSVSEAREVISRVLRVANSTKIFKK
jgi:putative peptidoglycan lipid II flippase